MCVQTETDKGPRERDEHKMVTELQTLDTVSNSRSNICLDALQGEARQALALINSALFALLFAFDS